jgi:hypothetical protein
MLTNDFLHIDLSDDLYDTKFQILAQKLMTFCLCNEILC